MSVTSPARLSPRQRNARSSLSADDGQGCGRGLGSCVIPFLIFVSFFFNFVFADIARVSNKYDTIITPPGLTFAIWIVIYLLEFCFVVYQLFYPKPRRSRLIQRRIALPFIFHQILTAVWLIIFSRERIYAATGVLTAVWLLALTIFSLITYEFRSGGYKGYSFGDYCLIEVPFAVLLGWETVATLTGWNIFVLRLQMDGKISEAHGVAAQLAGIIITFCVIVAAAILLAGLPMLMDPFIHAPIIWATFMIGYRWHGMEKRSDSPQLQWASEELIQGVQISAWVVCGIVTLFFIVAAIILGSSRLCLPDRSDSSSSGSSTSSVSRASPTSTTHRSPRTARSALSAERV